MLLPGRGVPGRAVVVVAVATVLLSSPSYAQRVSPLEATVLVRLIGNVRVLRGDDERMWREQLLNVREVEVGSGSGFIISPHGWVITNHHVVTSEKFIALVDGQKLEVTIDIARIEVVLPSTGGHPPRRFGGSVFAVDAELDLAILSLSGADFPYVGLGDSDAIAAGDSVSVVGYPFGAMLQLEKSGSSDTPDPSLGSGSVAALRTDANGDRYDVQVNATLNPGNSGGPIVDSEGYAIAVAHSRFGKGTGIGFGVPINRVKRLLQSHGLDSHLPVALLVAGGAITDTAKGISMRVPIGFEDESTSRVRVDAPLAASVGRTVNSGTSHEDFGLRIDRVATSQSLEQLERALVNEGTFERFHPSGVHAQSRLRVNNGLRMLTGHASGAESRTGAAMKVVYALVDLGKEKIVARYAGPADAIAANRSLLHASLSDLEVTSLLTAEVTRVLPARWAPTVAVGSGAELPAIDGWIVERGLPWHCATGLPQPSSGLAMSPAGDFTVMIRAAWHGASLKDATAAARTCSPQPGAHGATSYATRATAWGVTYQIEGVFVEIPGRGGWQFEMVTPVEKVRFVADVFANWIQGSGR